MPALVAGMGCCCVTRRRLGPYEELGYEPKWRELGRDQNRPVVFAPVGLSGFYQLATADSGAARVTRSFFRSSASRKARSIDWSALRRGSQKV
jgi:hypothetical protein